MLSLEQQKSILESGYGPTSPLIYRVGLSTTEPDVEGNNITNPGGNYAPVTIDGDEFQVVEVGVPMTDVLASNIDFIDFGQSGPTVAWGTVTHWTLELDDKGNWIFWEFGVITNRITGLPEPQTIGTEDYFSFDPDKFILKFKNQ